MRYLPRALLAGGIGFAVSCLAACGGGAGLLSGNQAASIQGKLDQLSTAVAAHNCAKAATHAYALGNSVVNLPATVNPTVRNDLGNGVSVASHWATVDCQHTTTTTTTSSPTTTKTTPTTTTTTTPTTTTTTPTTTTTTTPITPSTTTPPPTVPTTTSQSGGGGVGPGGGGAGGGG